MRHSTFLLLVSLTASGAAAIIACTTSENPDGEPAVEDGGSSGVIPPGPTTPTPTSTDAGVTTTTGPGTGLPCDIQGLLENRCQACHGMQNPPPLLTYENLTAKSTKDPNKTMAVVSLERMKAKEMPPAPAVPPDLDEIAAFEDWLKAGTPRNPVACNDDAFPDAAVPLDAGNVDAGDGGCTSGKYWTLGNKASPLMHPGAACNACHQQLGGPNLRIAGTVYKTAHEPVDCIGSAPPPQLKVVITDAKNKQFTLNVNASGNFESEDIRPRLPITAKIVDANNKTRQMNGKVSSGDCNSCHTQTGVKGAPGRIMAPVP